MPSVSKPRRAGRSAVGAAPVRVQAICRGVLARLLALALSLALLGAPGRVLAFVMPAEADVDAGSEWRYRSNLGTTVVRMLEREELRPGVEGYTWELRVAGLVFREDLELTAQSLGVRSREFSAFGLLLERFRFDGAELVMELPLQVGSAWTWSGGVEAKGTSGLAHVKGEVVRIEEITVPAGTFQTYRIRLERTDELGSRQSIELWFDPDVGPIRAIGDLRWRGLVGAVQELVGFTHFEVELVSYEIQRRSQGDGPAAG